MTAFKDDLAGRMAQRLGFYDSPQPNPDLDCTAGDLGQAYERGWNACLIEAVAFVRGKPSLTKSPSSNIKEAKE